ncbi:MAG: hypothetical protein RLZ98_3745 [Pseudomonadota bacterium]|jgi:hypothetical protein
MNEETLELLGAACEHRAFVIQDVMPDLGYETCTTSFIYVPGQVSHAAMAVMIESKWHFIDPTFGLYFSPKGKPHKVLSIREARGEPPGIEVMQSAGPAWTGKKRSLSDYAIQNAHMLNNPIKRGKIINPMLKERTELADVDQTYFASTLLDSETETYLEPFFIDLVRKPTGRFGKIDGQL